MADVFMMPQEPIRLNTRNEWLHGEDLIQERVAGLFAKSVHIKGDGSYTVRVGQDEQQILVDDTAFWVTSMVMDVDDTAAASSQLKRVRLHLSDGTSEWLKPETLMQSADNALYCRIERQGFVVPCRFNPQQYHALALHAQHTEDGYALMVLGKPFILGAYDRRPRPAGNN